jgi:hypothetical protein
MLCTLRFNGSFMHLLEEINAAGVKFIAEKQR